MYQTGRKSKKLLAVQMYERQITNFKRSTAPIWLCLCFGIVVCAFFLLNQLLLELNPMENEEQISRNDGSAHKKHVKIQNITSNDSFRVIMIDFNVKYF